MAVRGFWEVDDLHSIFKHHLHFGGIDSEEKKRVFKASAPIHSCVHLKPLV